MSQKLRIAAYKQSPSNWQEFRMFCQEKWVKISQYYYKKLVRGYPDRLKAVFDAKGATKKY